MQKTNHKRIIAFLTAVSISAISCAAVFAVKADNLNNKIVSAEQQALCELLAATERLHKDVGSVRYRSDGMALASAVTRIYADSQAAKTALSALPLSDAHLLRYEKLINQTGDYSLFLLKQVSMGEKITPEQLEVMERLTESTESAKKELSSINRELSLGELTVDTLAARFSGFEDILPKYDDIIYDGIYTDTAPVFKMLENAEELSENKALSKAEDFLNRNCTKAYENDGDIAVFGFSFGNGGIIEVTKKGGYILTLSEPLSYGDEEISDEQALTNAINVCERLGYLDMRVNRTKNEDGMLKVLLVPYVSSVNVYPDSITVGVDKGNGNICYINCAEYVKNHSERTFESAYIPENAKAALVLTDGGNEALCYEFFDNGVVRYICPETDLCRDCYILDESETFFR